jgi:integrase
MASFYKATNRDGFIAQVYLFGRAARVYLGKVNKTQARTICRYLDQLKIAAEAGLPAPTEAGQWADKVGPRIRKRLEAIGLVTTVRSEFPNQLGPFLTKYIASREDWKPLTTQKQNNVRRHLVASLGESTPLMGITEAAAERFARNVRKHYKPSHAGKLISIARQLLDAARKEKLITQNPFDGIDAAGPHDKEREAYVTAEEITRVISKATCYYGAVIAAARFAGLRCTSEVLALQWCQIDWEQGQIALDSPKTGRRLLPIFREFAPHLDKLFQNAVDGSRYVFDSYRGTADKTYRYNTLKAIELAGIKPWPKLFTNLRASCRTDLLDDFPEHVVNAWLGHGSRVGRKHYNRVKPEHYAAASGVSEKPYEFNKPRQDWSSK